MGEIGSTRAVAPLIAALEAGDMSVRSAAAMALGKLKDIRAIDPLLATLDEFSGQARKDALHALASLSGQQFGDDATAWRAWRKNEGR